MDYLLPGITGIEFIRKLKKENLDVPLTMVAGKGDKKIAVEAMKQGAYDYVVKDDEYYNSLPHLIDRAHSKYLLEKERAEKEKVHAALLEEILRSQKQWQATIDAVTDYIFVTDKNREIRRTNISFAKRFNKHPREIIGMKADLLLGIDIHHPNSTLEKAMSSNMPVSDEVRIGDETYMVSSFPAMFEDVEVFVYIMKDITEMKRLRDQIYQSDKLASLGLLVSGAAHEINNSLTGILGFAELLTMRIKDDSIRKELNKISMAAERCKKIVESLLCFSRQQTPQRSLENINEIIDRTLELRTYWFRSNNVEIIRDYGNIPLVQVGSQQMQQVILNIILNAEQSIADSGRRGRIVFTTAYDSLNKKIAIRISDNGHGIPKEQLPRIFDPFFTTKPVNKGTGLGLSITHSIIAEHGGTIRAESIEGEGATFIIEMPVS